jgi:hypothetical protein
MARNPIIREPNREVSAHDDDERPHGCYDGWVYLGFETEQDGELVEITDRVPCRRCQLRSGDFR